MFDTEEGDFVMLDDRISVEPTYELAELVDRITPEKKHDFSDTDFGKPVGKEKL